MDILKAISRRNFLGKLLDLGAIGALLLPLPPLLVHARRGRGGVRHREEDRQFDPRLTFSFDVPSKTAVHREGRLRMDMIHEMDEPLHDVRVRLQVPEGADRVGGADSWSGNLKKDDRIGFETLFTFRKAGVYKFRYTIEGTSDSGDFLTSRTISIVVVE